VAPGLRACFRAAPGYALVVADYAQIELRVAAHLAPCEAMRAVFREGRDPHRATAATLTGKPEVEVTPHERKLAKAVNFGFLFGMGAPRFRSYARDSYGVELDEHEAQRAREAFLRTFPGIARWHAKVAALGRARPPRAVTVRTALGRRKRFSADGLSFNAALNIPVQGTAADGFKLAMTRLLPRLRALGGRGILCVHDEYLAEVPTPHAEEARSVVEATMREAMQEIVTSVPIEVEASIATTWADE
jgi:DNA polymerase I-like protein with 3'-5' exonuclease and polymerase domains